jgi:2-aminoadipate transaminase
MFKLSGLPGVIPLAAGSPSPEAYPVEQLHEIIERLFETPQAFLNYGISEGYLPLREVTKKRLKEKYATSCDDDELIITSGGQQCMDLAAKCLIDEGDAVICESPTFSGSLNTFLSYGARLISCSMDEEGIKPEYVEHALKTEKNCRLIYVIPTFQNPSGRTLSAERRRILLDIAKKYDAMIIEDDPYSELRYTDRIVPTIKSMDDEGRVIYCGSYSKVVAPGVRVGFCLANQALIKKMTIGKQASDVHTNVLAQMMVYEFLTNYDLDAHLVRVRSLYREKRDIMLEELAKMDPRVSYTHPDGGLFIWCQLPDGMDSRDLADRIWERGKVLIVPGCSFEVDKFARNAAWRMNFSMPSKEDVRLGTRIVVECAGDMVT